MLARIRMPTSPAPTPMPTLELPVSRDPAGSVEFGAVVALVIDCVCSKKVLGPDVVRSSGDVGL